MLKLQVPQNKKCPIDKKCSVSATYQGKEELNYKARSREAGHYELWTFTNIDDVLIAMIAVSNR